MIRSRCKSDRNGRGKTRGNGENDYQIIGQTLPCSSIVGTQQTTAVRLLTLTKLVSYRSAVPHMPHWFASS